MNIYPPPSYPLSHYPPALAPDAFLNAIATVPWVFQSIDLPPNPEEKPWSRYCTVIDITSGLAHRKATALGLNTYALGLNNLGDVVGYYADPNYKQQHAFRRNRDGKIDIFDVLLGDKNPKPAERTRARGINKDGYIVGEYEVVSDGPSRPFLCWFRPGEKPRLENFATWTVPDQPDASTGFAKINNLFQIAGSYMLPDFRTYGFTLRGGPPTKNGDLTWFNATNQTSLESPPFPAFPKGFYPFLEPFGMNDVGDIVGTTNALHTTPPDPDGGEGFLIPAGSVDLPKEYQYYIPLVAPAVFGLDKTTPFPRVKLHHSLFTTAHGINTGGHVVGFYSTTTKEPNKDGDFHGFIASRNHPQLLPIDYWIYENAFQPNPPAEETRIHDINDHQEIVGTFRVSNKTKGFLLNPFARPVDEVIMNQMTPEMLVGISSLQPASAWPQMAWAGTGNLRLSDRARDAINALLLSEGAVSIRSPKERMQVRKAALEAAQTKVKELLRNLKRG